MSLESLRKFNQAYGYPLNHNEVRSPERSRMEELINKVLLAVPFLGLILAHKSPAKTDLNRASRSVLSATIIFLPLVLALDVIATVITQPLQKILDHKRVVRIEVPQDTIARTV
ncbi:MAG: hypothetical protein ACK5MA_05320 [Parachlamydiaceae bacterium]